MKIHYVGHSTLFIETNVKIIIDPYLKGKGREGISKYNPNASLSVDEVSPDVILLTHGHGDHFGQTFELLERTKAKLLASRRVCDFVRKRIGGREQILLRIEPSERVNIDETTVLALKAKHKFGLEGFGGDILGMLAYERYTPCGTNMGFLISAEGKKIYHSGDTYIVGDGVHNPDVAFLSMDGFRTLNEKESIEVIKEINARIVVPIHYRWLGKGRDTVKKVRGMIRHEAIDTSFKEMAYGEVMLL